MDKKSIEEINMSDKKTILSEYDLICAIHENSIKQAEQLNILHAGQGAIKADIHHIRTKQIELSSELQRVDERQNETTEKLIRQDERQLTLERRFNTHEKEEKEYRDNLFTDVRKVVTKMINNRELEVTVKFSKIIVGFLISIFGVACVTAFFVIKYMIEKGVIK